MVKKAQFGFDTFMSWIVFALFLFFTIIALSLTNCGSNKSKVNSGITTEQGDLAQLRASEQLSAYLRTDMPGLGVLKEKMRTTDSSLSVPSSKAIDFLEEHPDTYVGKTYGDFIASLGYYKEDSRANSAFDAVTKALFGRHSFSKDARVDNNGRLDKLYTSPVISVKYGSSSGFYYGSEDLASRSDLSAMTNPVIAFKVLPAPDASLLTVKLEVDPYQTRDELSRP